MRSILPNHLVQLMSFLVFLLGSRVMSAAEPASHVVEAEKIAQAHDLLKACEYVTGLPDAVASANPSQVGGVSPMSTTPEHASTRVSCQASYDAVAAEYAARIFDELQHKPLDRKLLDRFATRVRNAGPVCDLGCGPGQVARYLWARGVDVRGYDLSSKMVELARQLNPGIEFHLGDMTALDVTDEAWAGIAAFYSIIHITPELMTQTLQQLWRVLRPNGVLLLAFHIGSETIHLDEWWGLPVRVDFYFLDPKAIAGQLHNAGFEVEETIERGPYPEVEHQSRRAYIFARKRC